VDALTASVTTVDRGRSPRLAARRARTPANVRYLIRRAIFASSSRWRGVLGRFAGVRFIGVTGSAGKTAAVDADKIVALPMLKERHV
jgi:UDP-N-acetylmuramyl pentapeptide synthase